MQIPLPRPEGERRAESSRLKGWLALAGFLMLSFPFVNWAVYLKSWAALFFTRMKAVVLHNWAPLL